MNFLRATYFKLIILFFLLIFWQTGAVKLDPDFGWHLKVGEIIMESGIPQTDPFSYSMPSYNFVNHEWLTDILISKLYFLSGDIILSLIFSFLAVFAILIQIPTDKRKFAVIPVILAAFSILMYAGIRPQVISWFFLSILFKVVFNRKLWQKWRFFLPVFFLIWANLHGGYVTGIAVFILKVLLDFASNTFAKSSMSGISRAFFSKTKDQKFYDLRVLLLSVLSTLINPYGFNLWREIWISMFDGSLRWSIAEWIPSVFVPDFALWVYFSFSVSMIFVYRKKFKFIELILYTFFLLMGLSSIRNMPFWIIVSLPLTIKSVTFLYNEAKTKKGGILRFNKAYNVFFIIIILLSVFQSIVAFESAGILNEDSFYPQRAIQFLSKNKTNGQIFSIYDWGGYLIWKLPDKKVFIDGRMPSWRRDFIPSLQNDRSRESDYAFRDYKNIFDNKILFKEISKKYNIDTVLIDLPGNNNKAEVLKGFDNWRSNIISRFGKKGEYPDIYTQLKNEGWIEVYKDKVAVVYRKKT